MSRSHVVEREHGDCRSLGTAGRRQLRRVRDGPGGRDDSTQSPTKRKPLRGMVRISRCAIAVVLQRLAHRIEIGCSALNRKWAGCPDLRHQIVLADDAVALRDQEQQRSKTCGCIGMRTPSGSVPAARSQVRDCQSEIAPAALQFRFSSKNQGYLRQRTIIGKSGVAQYGKLQRSIADNDRTNSAAQRRAIHVSSS